MSYYADDTITVHHGDCLEVLATLPDASVDAVVTDPPYGLGFMGKEWDDLPPGKPWAEQCLRVLKPGGHLLAFGGTRTSHRLACAVEDAGFEIRDSIAWLYGSGFPKSLDVSKAIDKAAGAEREVVGQGVTGAAYTRAARRNADEGFESGQVVRDITAPATDAAQTWQGWGTALKPAHEPIVVARKPLTGTVAANVLTHGVGALNVDGCRVDASGEQYSPTTYGGKNAFLLGGYSTLAELEAAALVDAVTPDGKNRAAAVLAKFLAWSGRAVEQPAGRWPANVVLDETQAAALDQQSGESASPVGVVRGKGTAFTREFQVSQGYRPKGEKYANEGPVEGVGYGDTGGASRFFYTAKADTHERVRIDGTAHPTVKPLALMRWLVRLVTPPGGTVLEPFAGSGTTVEACILEGFRCVAIEREADYLPLILQRIHRRRDPVAAVKAAAEDGGLFDLLGEEDEPA